MHPSPRWPVLGLFGFLALLLIGWLLPVSAADLLHWGAGLSSSRAMLTGLVIAMALLMSFGLPGSLIFWFIAPFHAPWISVLLLLTGSTGGALGAYVLGRRLGERWRPKGYARQLLALLSARSDFMTQCALRILPGFPHAFINLSGGILRLPLGPFLSAAVIGLAIKWGVYAQAAHGMVNAAQADEVLNIQTLWPLVLIAVLMIAGALARRFWFKADKRKT
ncbi:MAG TPA: hypothetical protein ENI17_12160 [Pseudomonas xinjiangensis]|uniref:VTT domain-containing protein n=2 Tax=root TaxID=1 RepID=A0A7V1BP64_9GAMM|nr:hypothetical protein [Halopseudomonas xinjiangensis]HEC48365.1 hypothetical protein [Halopseudomonas xinjiangensis]